MSFRDSRDFAVRAVLLASLVVLSALPVHALPLDAGAGWRDSRGAVTGFMNELRRVWDGLWDRSGLSNAASREGMGIDPSGQPRFAITPPDPIPGEGTL